MSPKKPHRPPALTLTHGRLAGRTPNPVSMFIFRSPVTPGPGSVNAAITATAPAPLAFIVEAQQLGIKHAAIAVGTPAPTAAVHAIASSSPTPSDFATRRSAAGVIRYFDFDDNSQLGGDFGANFGTTPSSGRRPVIDTVIKASGTGSLRIDIPSLSGDDPGGTWFGNFSTDLLTQFGAGTTFYVQWRQRFNQAFVDTLFYEGTGSTVQGGIKQAIITAGDQTGGVTFSSCVAIGNVVQTYAQERFPIVYNSCTGSGTHPPYSGMYESIDSGRDLLLENGMPSPYCKFSDGDALGAGVVAPIGCFKWVADEWMTFKMMVTIGTRNLVTNDFDGSIVKFWGARENQPSQLLLHWRPGISGYFPLAAGPVGENQRFGKIWLLPFMTNKYSGQVHPLAQTWYDELIISTQDIADPAVTPGLPAFVPAPGTIANISLNTLASVDPCPLSNCVYSGIEKQLGIFDWCGAAYVQDDGPYGSLSMTGGGHAAYYGDEVYQFDFNTRVWVRMNSPSLVGASTPVDSFGETSTGIPASSHTYQMMQQLPASLGGGVKGSTLLVSVLAAGVSGVAGARYSHKFDHNTRVWTRFSSNAPTSPDSAAMRTAVFDTTRGAYWRVWSGGLYVSKLDSAGVWTDYSVPSGGGNNFGGFAVTGYCPTLDLLVMIDMTTWAPWYLQLSNIAAGWFQCTTSGVVINNTDTPGSINWSPLLGKFGMYNANAENYVQYLTPPASPSGTWVWTLESFSGGSPALNDRSDRVRESYNRFLWVEVLHCWAWFDGVNSPVQLWRPLGT